MAFTYRPEKNVEATLSILMKRENKNKQECLDFLITSRIELEDDLLEKEKKCKALIQENKRLKKCLVQESTLINLDKIINDYKILLKELTIARKNLNNFNKQI